MTNSIQSGKLYLGGENIEISEAKASKGWRFVEEIHQWFLIDVEASR